LKVVKEAKDGKLVMPEKKIKIEDSSFPEGYSLREKTSEELPQQTVKLPQKQVIKK
jgi:hypothetical protein